MELKELLQSEVTIAKSAVQIAELKLRMFEYLTSNDHMALPQLQAYKIASNLDLEALRERIENASYAMAVEFDKIFGSWLK